MNKEFKPRYRGLVPSHPAKYDVEFIPTDDGGYKISYKKIRRRLK